MRRREFIKMIAGTAAAWPLTARAQQPRPVIGFLSSASPDAYSDRLRALRQGLKEVGYVEGQNVQIEYRWAEGRNDQLATLAAELVRQQVAVIVAGGGTPSALAAKAATATIPIVFAIAADPVEVGLVTSVNRPGGNLTGVTNLNVEIGPKRLELLHELVPAATMVAVLVDPTSPTISEAFVSGLQTAAPTFWDAARCPAREHRTRNRNGLCNFATTTSRRPRHWPRHILQCSNREARRTIASPRGADDLPVSPICSGRRPGELRKR